MADNKCKTCDCTIEFKEGATVGVCEGCGVEQTLPRSNADRNADSHNQAMNAGVEPESARQIIQHFSERINDLQSQIFDKKNELSLLGTFKKREKKAIEKEIIVLQQKMDEEIANKESFMTNLPYRTKYALKIPLYFGKKGGTPIEWEILAVKGDQILIFSKLGLLDLKEDDKYFRDSCNCTRWLNLQFREGFFTSAEKARIIRMNVSTDRNLNRDTTPSIGDGTHVFLLSPTEVETYVPSETRKCLSGAWELRSSNGYYVDKNGSIREARYFRRDSVTYLRPAMWINLEPQFLYDVAMSSYTAGKYNEAIRYFEDLDGYKDSASMIEKCNTAKCDAIKNKYCKVGDTIYFGKYKQDTKSSDEKEDIEWIVLNRVGTKVLVISKYALDEQPHEMWSEFHKYWYNHLIGWLNNCFYRNAFNHEQKKMIINATIDSGATRCRIFILSVEEVEKYFDSDEARECVKTPHAGGYWYSCYNNASGKVTCEWWLRSKIDRQHYACIRADGSVDKNSRDSTLFIRPAMWIDLAK